MGLNHIYKVIWSKTKNAWVVVSEIAKRDGKSSVKSVVTSLAGKSVAAVMVAMVMCGGVASANTVYGPGAIVNGSNSTAIGDNANIDNLSKDSVAIGPNASIINGTDSVTIGSSSSSKKFGIAIGGAAKSSDTGVIAIGRNTNSKKEDSITIGNYADNDGGSIVIGRGSTINNYDPSRTSRSGILIGDNSKSIDVGSIGIGNQVSIGSTSASSHSSYAIAIGDAARVEGDNSIVIGHAANSALQASRAIAIGAGARSDGSHSIALGSAIVNHDNAIAIGKQTMTSGDGSIAIGHAATIKENYITPSSNSIAIGQEVSVDGGTSIAMGYGVRVDANRTVAIGSNNRRSNVLPYDWMPIVASNSVVLGYNHQLDNSSSSKITTLGYHNTVDASRTIVIGNEIVVANDLEGAVVLGDSSEASPYVRANDVTISGMTIQSNSFAGNSGSKGSILSIGSSSNNRQIKNVAAGVISATSTDAVNGSQLYEAVRAVTAGASPDVYMHVNDGTSTQGAGGGNNLGKANEKSGALGNYSIAVGRNAQSKGTNSISIGYQSGTTNDQSIAIGGNAHVNSSHSIAIGDNANASGTYSIAMGASSVNGDKNLALNNSYVYSGNDSVAINGSLVAGNNNIAIGGAYIGAGRTYSRDASGNPTSTIMNMQTAAPTLGISSMQGEQYLEPVKNSIAIGNNAYVTRSNTIVMGDKTFDNIKSSKTATDFIAPTKSQFSSIISGSINLYHEGTLGNSVYLGHDSYAFTPDALTDGESSSSGENSIHTKKYDATGNIVVSNNTTGGAFGKVSKATINGDEITGFAGAQSVGAVTIGAGDYERRIQNVAAGEVSATSTDGINGSQLYAVADTLSKNMSSYMHVNDGTSTQTVGNATTNYGYSGSKAGATGTKSIAGGVNAQASGEEAIAIGSGAKASGEKSISIGTGNEVKGNKSSAIGDPSYIDTTATGTHVHGNDNGTATNPIKASESTFMGNTNLAGTAGTTGIHVVGNSNSVDSSNVMVMGNNITVGTGLDGAVVLGHASSADQYAAATDSTINGVTFEAAGYAGNTGLNNGSIVSVGATGTERQIKNVAAGAVTATSTDAINGSQLYKTAETILKMPINMAGDSGDTVGLKLGKTVNIKGSVASGADVTDGNIAVVGDKATSTLSFKMAKNLTGLTSGTFTDATGNQTVINGAGVTVTPTGTGATPISITTSGINAGNQEIKGVKKGTTDDAAVNKKQMDDALAGISSTLTINDGATDGSVNIKTGKLKVVGESGANALVTTTVSGDTISVGTSTKLQNAVTAAEKSADKDLSNLSTTGSDKVKTLAQDAVKVAGTGLATVSDATAAGVKTYTVNVDEGKLVIDDTTGKVGAAGSTQGTTAGKDGVATTQNVASVVNAAIDKTTQALADAEHKFDGDTGTTSVRKHGEVLSIKGGVATSADLTTGNIGVVSDGAGTLNIRLAKVLSGLTSATFTSSTGTTVINGDGLTVTPSAAGTNPISITTGGINAGNTEIRGVAAATHGDAAVNKAQMDTAIANAASVASSTEKVIAKTLTGDTNLVTVTNQTGTPQGETYEVAVSENAIKAAAQDAVKVAGTGLATVSDATAAGVKTYTVNVDEGKLVIDDTTGKVGAAGSTQGTTAGKDGVATTQNVASVVNAAIDKTTQALADAKHDFAGDDSTVISRKHGEKLNIKGGASTTAADLTAGNIAVLGDAATGTLNIRMAKALTGLSSATFTTPSGTTVINGGGMTITPSTTGAAPISITTGGINAGNTEIKNVAAGTTATSAVNKQQMDNAISNATANVGFNIAGNTGTGSVTNGQTLTITGTNGIETNASGQSITVGLDAATRAQINNATTTANNAAKKDLSNIDNAGKQVIKDTAAWNVKVNGAAAETVKGGDTVTFNDGDNIKVTNTGKDITIATKKDVSFDKVTVGNVVIDKNTNRISGLANAANNDEAVNLGQMNAAISTATAGTGNIKYKANGGTQNSVALTTGFDFKGDSNIQITSDPANSGVINYKLNPALTGITSISGGTGAPTITLNAGSGSTPGNVSINSNLDMGGKQINNIGAATHAGDAVNKAQMDQALQNIAGASSNVAKSYAYKAGAGAAALAALKPIQYDPLEPTQIMAGIGNYKSQTAVALGVAHYTNENTMFNLGVSLDSHDGIVNAGVTHKFGYSPEKKAIPDKYKGGPISSIYVMQDEVTALQAIVQKQAAENEALRQQNEDMQRKVDMILAKIQ